ncbi:MAG: hypothetical protein AAGK02_10110 [Pseudomonadota bacterium]
MTAGCASPGGLLFGAMHHQPMEIGHFGCYSTVMLKRRSRRSPLLNWWMLWRVPVLLLIVMAGWWFLFRPLADGRGWIEISRDFSICGESSDVPSQGCVIDGDTLAIGFGANARRIRLTGFDAPELDGACNAEREAAVRSRQALHDWLANGRFEWNGSDQPPYDQYGRELREVRRIDGDGSTRYLAEDMIAQGLAAESGWNAEPKDWCE